MPGLDRRREERGQLLAVFAMVLVVLIGMVGLILDGGSTFVQRREQQNVADSAAMAAGYTSVMGGDPVAAARAAAAANGYVHGQGGTTVNATVSGPHITVDITRPHRNNFAGIMGFGSWDVGTTATVQAGVPNAVLGAMPLIFNEKAFNLVSNTLPDSPAWFSEPPVGTEDVPQNATTFNWTVYCTASGSTCNADSTTVDGLINGAGDNTTVSLSDTIAPLNAGAHTTLFSDMANHIGDSYPVGIVDDEGNLAGWAWFRVTGSVGGSTKQIGGYFESMVNVDQMTITATGGTPFAVFGAYTVKLIN